MDTLVDDIGSFPLPFGIGRESFSKAYQLAREAILQGKDITKDDFLQSNFCNIVLDAFKKKIASGLDVVNFPQQYDGIKQVGDVIHVAMEKGSFLVEEKNAVLPEVYLNQSTSQSAQRGIWQKDPVTRFNFWSSRAVFA